MLSCSLSKCQQSPSLDACHSGLKREDAFTTHGKARGNEDKRKVPLSTTRFFVRNMSIRNMRLKLGKNYEAFNKEHRQSEFKKQLPKNVFTGKFLIKLARIE